MRGKIKSKVKKAIKIAEIMTISYIFVGIMYLSLIKNSKKPK
tara:strand:- start:83 stop:208 length:126 start_codon:yes stop_codon:yes gene_type:complete